MTREITLLLIQLAVSLGDIPPTAAAIVDEALSISDDNVLLPPVEGEGVGEGVVIPSVEGEGVGEGVVIPYII